MHDEGGAGSALATGAGETFKHAAAPVASFASDAAYVAKKTGDGVKYAANQSQI